MRSHNLIRTTYIQKTLIMVCKSNFRKIIQNEDVDKEIKIIIDRYKDKILGIQTMVFFNND